MPEPPMDGPLGPSDGAPMPDEDMPPMDTEPPMDDAPMGPEGESENGEINDIFSKLDTEKQAAVIKYAKSMVNDKEDNAEPPVDDAPMGPEGDMPMEAKRRVGQMIDEIVNNILSSEETDEEDNREDKKIRNPRVKQSNPNIAKTQRV